MCVGDKGRRVILLEKKFYIRYNIYFPLLARVDDGFCNVVPVVGFTAARRKRKHIHYICTRLYV